MTTSWALPARMKHAPQRRRSGGLGWPIEATAGSIRKSTRRVHLPDAVPAVPLSEWAVGTASGRTLPQLKPHHRKTGERLIVKCVLQKLFHFFLELSGVRRVRFLLLWQGCALQRGSPKGRRFRQRESAPPRRRGRASLAKPSFRALRSECSDNRDISIEKAPAFPGRGGACCLESRFLAAASAKNVPLSFAVDFCISALNMLMCG